MSGDSLLAEIKRKQKLRDEIISDIKMILDNLTSTNDFEIKQKLNKKYKEANSKLNRLDNDLKYLESKQSNSLSSKDRMDEMMKILNKKKVTSNILNNEMIGVFFYRIFVVNKNELVFVINSTNSLSLDELIEKRNDIINQDSVYENVLTMPDPKKKATIKYKVVLI